MLMDSLRTRDRPITDLGRGRHRPEPHIPVKPRGNRETHPRTSHARDRRSLERGASNQASDRRASQWSILCGDDDHIVVRLLAHGLAELGYAVDTAHDGEVGLAKILADQPDLILCDVSMPRMGGFELLQRLREAGPEYIKLPLILLTSHGDRESELAGRRLGADDCLTKPVDFEMLGVVVENRLRRADGRGASRSEVHLAHREKEVLIWVGRGKTSAEIAIILGVSERTVNFHCEQAMKRLAVVRRTQAVATALAQGLIAV